MKLRVPPLAQLVVCALIGWLAAGLVPQFAYSSSLIRAIGWVLTACGGLILTASTMAFIQAKTTVNPMTPSQANQLVRTGLYRYSRNPMYLGMAAVLVGFALLLQNAIALVAPALFVLAITYLQIVPEERILARQFGQDFDSYRKSVARWI